MIYSVRVRRPCIIRQDAEIFCESENTRLIFKQQEANINPIEEIISTELSLTELHNSVSESKAQLMDSTSNSSNEIAEITTANYKDLAKAFSIKDSEDNNLEWFHERCSNPSRNLGFKNALVTRGKRGAGKNAARFDVLKIAFFLIETKHLNQRTIRRAIGKNFPEVLDQFDMFMPQDD